MSEDRSINDSSGNNDFARQLRSDMAKSDAEKLKADVANAQSDDQQSASGGDESVQNAPVDASDKPLGDIADEKLRLLALKSIDSSKHKTRPRQKKPMAMKTRLFLFAGMLALIMVCWLVLSRIFPMTLSDSETSMMPVLVQYMPFIAIGLAALLSFGSMLCDSTGKVVPKIIYFIIMIVTVIFIIIALKFIATGFTSVIDTP